MPVITEEHARVLEAHAKVLDAYQDTYQSEALASEAGVLAIRLVADVLSLYDDDVPCLDCHPRMMCRFHSLVSFLAGRTFTPQALERARQWTNTYGIHNGERSKDGQADPVVDSGRD